MSIRPATDLVLDVVRAADPARAAAASARLARAEAAAPAQPFVAALRVAEGRPAPAPAQGQGQAQAQGTARDPVGKGLEEVLMRQMLQDVLPKKAASVYGGGTAGDVWRSLFAEQLAHAMSSAGRVGLAGRLVKQASAS